MNIIGAIGALVCIKKKPEKFGLDIWVPVSGNWGLSLGMFIFGNSATLSHEHGHSFQNAVFGPFMIFLVGIPSVTRFWYYEAVYRWGNYKKLPDYDSVWFEAMATHSGKKFLRR